MGAVQSTPAPEIALAGVVIAGSAAAYFALGNKGDSADASKSTTSKKLKRKESDSDSVLDEILAEAKAKDRAQELQARSRPDAGSVPGSFIDAKGDTDSPAPASDAREKRAHKRKRGKKSSTLTPTADDEAQSTEAEPIRVPDPITEVQPPKKKAKSKGKKVKKTSLPAASSSKAASTNSPPDTPPSVPTSLPPTSASQSGPARIPPTNEGSWTRVEKSRNRSHPKTETAGDPPTSDAGLTTSQTDASSARTDKSDDEADDTGDDGASETDDPQPLLSQSQKSTARGRKTGVEDMLDTATTAARTESPFGSRTREDLEESTFGLESATGNTSADDEEGWGIVKRRTSRNKLGTVTSSEPTAAGTASTPPGSEPLTKKQRENAARRAAQKAEKSVTEQARLEGLAKHKRALEKIRMEEHAKSGSRKLSGGMTAKVDPNGMLIWD